MDSAQRRRKILQLKHRYQQQQQQLQSISVVQQYASLQSSSQHQGGNNHHYRCHSEQFKNDVDRQSPVLAEYSPSHRYKQRQEVVLFLEEQKKKRTATRKTNKARNNDSSNQYGNTPQQGGDSSFGHSDNSNNIMLRHEQHSILKYDHSTFMEDKSNFCMTNTADNPEEYETPPRIRSQMQQQASDAINAASDVFRAKMPLTPSTSAPTAFASQRQSEEATGKVPKVNDALMKQDERQQPESVANGDSVQSPPRHHRVIRSSYSDSDVAFGVTFMSTGDTTNDTSDEDDSSFGSYMEERQQYGGEQRDTINDCMSISSSLPPTPGKMTRTVNNTTRLPPQTPSSGNAINGFLLPTPAPFAPGSIARSSPSVAVDDQSSYVSSCSSEHSNMDDEDASTGSIIDEQKQRIFLVGTNNCAFEFDVTKSYSNSTADVDISSTSPVDEEELLLEEMFPAKGRQGMLNESDDDDDDDDILDHEDMFYASSETDLHLIHLAITRSSDAEPSVCSITAGNNDRSPRWYSKAKHATPQTSQIASESWILQSNRRGSGDDTAPPHHPSSTSSHRHRRHNSDLGDYSSNSQLCDNSPRHYQVDDGGSFMRRMILNEKFDVASYDSAESMKKSPTLKQEDATSDNSPSNSSSNTERHTKKWIAESSLKATSTDDTVETIQLPTNNRSANKVGSFVSSSCAPSGIHHRSHSLDGSASTVVEDVRFGLSMETSSCITVPKDVAPLKICVPPSSSRFSSPSSFNSTTPTGSPSSPRLCLGSFILGCVMTGTASLSFFMESFKKEFKDPLTLIPSNVQSVDHLLYYVLLPFTGFVVSRNLTVALLCLYATQAFQILFQFVSAETNIELDASSMAWGAIGILWGMVHLQVWDAPVVYFQNRKLSVGIWVCVGSTALMLCEPRSRIFLFTLILSFGVENFRSSIAYFSSEEFSSASSISLSVVLLGLGLLHYVVQEFITDSCSILCRMLCIVSYMALTVVAGYTCQTFLTGKRLNHVCGGRTSMTLQILIIVSGAACCARSMALKRMQS